MTHNLGYIRHFPPYRFTQEHVSKAGSVNRDYLLLVDRVAFMLLSNAKSPFKDADYSIWWTQLRMFRNCNWWRKLNQVPNCCGSANRRRQWKFSLYVWLYKQSLATNICTLMCSVFLCVSIAVNQSWNLSYNAIPGSQVIAGCVFPQEQGFGGAGLTLEMIILMQ